MSQNFNVKGMLIAQLANAGLGSPIFQCEQQGPSHAPLFRATILLGEYVIGEGEGKTKKEAERVASAQALEIDLEHLSAAKPQKSKSAAGAANIAHAPKERRADRTAEQVDQADDEVWPIYSEVLAKSIDIAFELADEKDGPEEVRGVATQFYRNLLSSLGHHPTHLTEMTDTVTDAAQTALDAAPAALDDADC